MALDFPSSPADGQQYSGYVYDATRGVWSHFDYLSGASLLGTIYGWPLEEVPSWALECNGQAVSRTTYSGLFALLGTTYGVGDGSTTFNLPDYRGDTLVGKSTSGTFSTLGAAVGSETTNIPNHTHQHVSPIGMNSGYTRPISQGDTTFFNTHGSVAFSGIVTGTQQNNTTGLVSGGVEKYIVTSSASGAATPSVVQPSAVIKWIICAATSTGEFNTEVQTALVSRVSDTPLSQNFVLNGAMDFWQRGTTVTASSTVTYSADRWETFRGTFASGLSVSRETTEVPTGFEYYARVSRSNGDTSTQPIFFGQPFETLDSSFLAGKTVTLSFYARRGSGFSSSSNILTARIISGTGTDQTARTAITGQVDAATLNQSLTTTFTRYSVTGTIPANSNQVFVMFNYTPTGTATSTDRFDVTGIQLEVGDAVTPFRRAHPSVQAELAACQRYYYAIVRQAGSATNSALPIGWTPSTTSLEIYMQLPQLRRAPDLEVSSAGHFIEQRAATTPSNVVIVNDGWPTGRMSVIRFTLTGMIAGGAGNLRTNNTAAVLALNAEL